MKTLEEQLEHDLRRTSPPAGFAGRVMAGLPAAQPEFQPDFQPELPAEPIQAAPGMPDAPAAMPHFRSRARLQWTWPLAAAAVLLLGFASLFSAHQYRERRQAALDQARFALAMRLTAQALAHVDQRISRTGLRPLRRAYQP